MLNPLFSSIGGNPFPEPEESDNDCLSVRDTSDLSEGSDSIDSSDSTAPNHSDVDNVSLSDSDSVRSEEEVVEELMGVDFTPYSSHLDSATLTALDLELQDSSELAELAVSATESQSAEANATSSPPLPEFGPITFDQHKEDLKARLNVEFEGLKLPDENLSKYVEYFRADRVFVEVDQIVSLFNGQCPEFNCNDSRKVVDKKIDAGVLLITHKCTRGHGGVWSSSSVLAEKRGQKLYVSSVLLASSVLVSGNNFEKVSLLAKEMNLNYVSSSTFSRIQSLYALPSIRDLWDRVKEVVWKVFENDVLVLCGDGRMDSPGFSAKYCVYTMMEHYLNIIVDLEVVDKREGGGTSTLMEKMGCKRLLERMMNSLNLGEIVTDASRVIMKMVRELKGTK